MYEVVGGVPDGVRRAVGLVAGPVRLLARGAAVAGTSTAATRPQDQAHLLNRTTNGTGPSTRQASSSLGRGPLTGQAHLHGGSIYRAGSPIRQAHRAS